MVKVNSLIFIFPFFVLSNLFSFSQNNLTKLNYNNKSLSFPRIKKINDSTLTFICNVYENSNLGANYLGFIKFISDNNGNIISYSPLYKTEAHSNFPNVKDFVFDSNLDYTICGEAIVNGIQGIFIAKMKTDDSLEWSKTINVNSYSLTGDFIFQDIDLSILIVGSCNSDTSTINRPFLLKMDSMGIILWFKTLNFPANTTFGDLSYSIKRQNGKILSAFKYNGDLLLIETSSSGDLKVLNTETISLAGSYIRMIELNNGDIILSGNYQPTINSNLRFTIVKIDSLGEIGWAKEVNYKEDVFFLDLIVKNNDIMVVGTIRNINNRHKYQGFITNIQDAGNIQWSKKIFNPFGINDQSVIYTIINNSDSTLLLSGNYQSEFEKEYGLLLTIDAGANSGCVNDTLNLTQDFLPVKQFSFIIDTLSFTPTISPCNVQITDIQVNMDNDCIPKPIKAIDYPPSLIVSPNPTTGLINISIIGEQEKKHISIYDLLRQLIVDMDIQSSMSIDLSNFSQGVYILNFTSKELSYCTKIIKY